MQNISVRLLISSAQLYLQYSPSHAGFSPNKFGGRSSLVLVIWNFQVSCLFSWTLVKSITETVAASCCAPADIISSTVPAILTMSSRIFTDKFGGRSLSGAGDWKISSKSLDFTVTYGFDHWCRCRISLRIHSYHQLNSTCSTPQVIQDFHPTSLGVGRTGWQVKWNSQVSCSSSIPCMWEWYHCVLQVILHHIYASNHVLKIWPRLPPPDLTGIVTP